MDYSHVEEYLGCVGHLLEFPQSLVEFIVVVPRKGGDPCFYFLCRELATTALDRPRSLLSQLPECNIWSDVPVSKTWLLNCADVCGDVVRDVTEQTLAREARCFFFRNNEVRLELQASLRKSAGGSSQILQVEWVTVVATAGVRADVTRLAWRPRGFWIGVRRRTDGASREQALAS